MNFETQHNSTTHEEDFFLEKNQLPQVGLEPTTLCSLDQVTTSWHMYAYNHVVYEWYSYDPVSLSPT